MHKENFNHFLASVVSNPFEGLDPATQIQIERRVFVPNDPLGVYPIYNMAHYDGVLLSVHFATNTWSTVEGSAVMVAPGVAIASAHVIEPLIPHIMASELVIYCTGLTPHSPDGTVFCAAMGLIIV